MSEDGKKLEKLLIEGHYAEAISFAKRMDKSEAAMILNDAAVSLRSEAGVEDIPDIELLFRAALRLQPENAIIHYNLGLLLSEPEVLAANPEFLTKAERCFLRAIELDPTLKAAHYNLALLYAYTARLEDAEKIYESLMKEGVENEEWLNNLKKVIEEQREKGKNGTTQT